jgi:hypothetical protein
MANPASFSPSNMDNYNIAVLAILSDGSGAQTDLINLFQKVIRSETSPEAKMAEGNRILQTYRNRLQSQR